MYGEDDDRRLTRQICTVWPDLDPFEVSGWPWHRRAFYLEWLEDRAAAEDRAADDEAKAEVAAQIPSGAVGIEGLVAMAGPDGPQVREAS